MNMERPQQPRTTSEHGAGTEHNQPLSAAEKALVLELCGGDQLAAEVIEKDVMASMHADSSVGDQAITDPVARERFIRLYMDARKNL
ncbi:MAG: hypothetical protein KBE09_05120 [Candidatus Pacebacteria bacterium]|nr:hypothetical protein [Candidatus Paceibacterota bacterium]